MINVLADICYIILGFILAIVALFILALVCESDHTEDDESWLG